jgi:chemotaxis protein methyltransferase CheR
VISESGLERFEVLVRERVHVTGTDTLSEYVRRLGSDPEWEEWRQLLGRITNKESSLYRGRAQIDAIRDLVVPSILDSRASHPIRVWSAACARGEEAATIALTLANVPGIDRLGWEVLGTDVDDAALDDARQGSFSPRAVARVPEHELAASFTQRGGRYELVSELRRHLSYRFLNLASEPLHVADGPFDIVLLRNVLIYFRPEVQSQVVRNVVGAMADEGYLFLGPSESLRHLDSDLEVQHLGACCCYRRPGTPDAPTPLLRDKAPARPLQVEPPPTAGASPSTAEEGFSEAVERALWELENGVSPRDFTAVDRLRRHFADHPTVHAIEGLFRERSGDLEAAVEAYRGALYLAPTRFDIRFLLARTLHRCGQWRRAEREYRSVMSSLGDPSPPGSMLLGRAGVPGHRGLRADCRENIDVIKYISQN